MTGFYLKDPQHATVLSLVRLQSAKGRLNPLRPFEEGGEGGKPLGAPGGKWRSESPLPKEPAKLAIEQ